MKKEILIAIFFTFIIFITPFTVIARENKVSSNLEEEKIEELVSRLKKDIDELIQKYEHIPKVSYFINFLSNLLSLLGQIALCVFLTILVATCLVFTVFFFAIGQYEVMEYFFIWALITAIYADTYCPVNKKLKYDFILNYKNKIEIPNFIGLTEKIKDINECPCLKE